MRFKKILAGVMTFAVAITAAATPLGNMLPLPTVEQEASAEFYTKQITSKTDSRITQALNAIDQQADTATCKQSGKSVREMIYYFLYESTYAVYGGTSLPKGNTNASGSSSNPVDDGKYKQNVAAVGCLAYAKWVRNTINSVKTSNGSDCNTLSKADLTANKIKDLLIKYGQAGESLSMGSKLHTIVFVSAFDSGFYYMDWSGTYGDVPRFCWATYSDFASECKNRGAGGLWLAKCIDKENSTKLDLTKTPLDIGTNMTVTIRNPKTGKYLTADKATGNVSLQDFNGSANQRWVLTKQDGNYYEIVSGADTAKRLDVSNGGNTDGANVQIWKDNDTNSQRFGFYGSQDNYVIKPKYSSDKVVDCDGVGGDVHLWTYGAGWTQQLYEVAEWTNASSNYKNSSIKNITTNSAFVQTVVAKTENQTALRFRVTIYPESNPSAVQNYEFKTNYANGDKGKPTQNTINFDFGPDECKFTLTPNTHYFYLYTGTYTEGGKTIVKQSPTYDFTTSAGGHTHSFKNYGTARAATCTTEGLEIGTCSCGLTNTRTISALGHNYAENYEAAHPHKVYKKCTRCGDYYYTGDQRFGEISSNNAVAATCTSAGKQSDTKCNVCGVTITTGKTIPAKGHSYGSWTTVSAPNFVQSGTEKRTCSSCGTVETRSTSKNTMSMGKVTTSSDCSKISITFPTIPLAEGYTVKRSDGVTVANIKDPAYRSFKIDDFNTGRKECQTIVYTNGGTKVNTNKWGVEIAVDKTGTVIEKRGYLSEIQLNVPEGGFVVSAIDGQNKVNETVQYLLSSVAIGDKVAYDKANNKLMLSVMSDKCHLFKIDNYNAPREACKTIVYTSGGYWDSKTGKWVASGTKVDTNKWGVEFAVDKTGTVIQKRGYCSETQLDVPEDGFVVSTINGANGEINDACDYMISNVVAGDKITYNKTNNTLIVHTYLTKNYTYTDKTAKSGTSYTYTVTPYVGSVTGNGSTSSAVSLSAHKYGSWTTTKAATCTAAGTQTRSCSACGNKETKTIAATGHKYGSWTTTKAATCTAAGTQTRTCSSCGGKETKTIAATGHKSVSANNGKAATCTAAGKESDTKCSVCGVTITTGKTIAAKGHSYGSWTTTKAATCTAAGTQTRTCSSCGGKETKTIAATGHKYTTKVVAPTASAQGYTLHTCSVCGSSYKDNYVDKLQTSVSNVTGLKVIGKASTALRIGWNKNTNADGYIVEMYKGGKWTRMLKISSNTTTEYKKTALAQGTTYKFRVKAYKMNGKTAVYSGYTTVSGTTTVANVTGLKMTVRSKTAVRFGWNKNASASGYIVEMYKNGKWVRAAKIAKNSTVQFRKTGLTPGTKYQFRVKAYKTTGSTTLYSGYTNLNISTT